MLFPLNIRGGVLSAWVEGNWTFRFLTAFQHIILKASSVFHSRSGWLRTYKEFRDFFLFNCGVWCIGPASQVSACQPEQRAVKDVRICVWGQFSHCLRSTLHRNMNAGTLKYSFPLNGYSSISEVAVWGTEVKWPGHYIHFWGCFIGLVLLFWSPRSRAVRSL